MLELTYFAARGSCDKIRLLLAECSISYKENIISGYDFEDIKYKIEFGSLPLLSLLIWRVINLKLIRKYRKWMEIQE